MQRTTDYEHGWFSVVGQGDPGEHFFILDDGEFRVTILKDGKQIEILRYKPNPAGAVSSAPAPYKRGRVADKPNPCDLHRSRPIPLTTGRLALPVPLSLALRPFPSTAQNPCFGELALMYSKPRAASVTAMTDGALWEIDRRSFREILKKSSTKNLMRTLRSVQILKSLSVAQVGLPTSPFPPLRRPPF